MQAQNWSGQASQHTRQSAEPARTTGLLSGADVEDRIDHAHEPHRTRAGSLLPEAVMATTARVADNSLLGIATAPWICGVDSRVTNIVVRVRKSTEISV